MLAIEILAQRHVLAVIVFEYGVERQRLIEPLLDIHVRKRRGPVCAAHVQQILGGQVVRLREGGRSRIPRISAKR